MHHARNLHLLLLPLLLPLAGTRPHVAAAATGGSPGLPPECSRWIRDYVDFHARTKHSPEAKYILWQDEEESYHGLGDRLRGILWLLRVAAASQRVLLVRQDYPAPFETFFSPAEIDWRADDGRLPPVPASAPRFEAFLKLVPPQLEDGSFYNWTDTYLVFSTNLALETPFPKQLRVWPHSMDSHCLFVSMFAPSPAVEQAALQLYREAGIDPSKPYTAVHLRLGNLYGEADIFPRFDKYNGVLAAVKCAQDWQRNATGSGGGGKVLVLADDLVLKELVRGGLFTDAVTTSTAPFHFGTGRDARLPDHVSAVADMLLLKQAARLVFSRSGFGMFAQMWAGPKQQRTTVNDCITTYFGTQ